MELSKNDLSFLLCFREDTPIIMSICWYLSAFTVQPQVGFCSQEFLLGVELCQGRGTPNECDKFPPRSENIADHNECTKVQNPHYNDVTLNAYTSA